MSQEFIWPEPTREYTVGWKEVQCTGSVDRIFNTAIYYPSNIPSHLESYDKPSDDAPEPGTEEVMLAINSLKVKKVKDAPPAPGSFPVVVLEHGGGCGSAEYISIIQELVSHGYGVWYQSIMNLKDFLCMQRN